MNKNVIIVGGFIEIIELVVDCGYFIQGFIDNHLKGDFKGYPVLGTDKDAVELLSNLKTKVHLLITPDQPKVRENLYHYYSHFDVPFLKLISKNAMISKSSHIDEGTVIQSCVNVSSECNISKFVKLNTFCNIMHNSQIGSYTTIAPNAVVLGYVSVGKRCYIGSNSTILPNISISDDVVIGAGAVVTKNITNPGIYAGCPAKRLIKYTDL
jgi:sugar O-acyltransferase (sialic acid O-acetyltransferase NeuD family)